MQEGRAPVARIRVTRSLTEAGLLDRLVQLVRSTPEHRRHAVKLIFSVDVVLRKTTTVRRDDDEVDVHEHAEAGGGAVV